MIIEINDSLTIGALSDGFNRAFPFLSIRFFANPHAWGEASSMDQLLDADTSIASLSKVHGSLALEIHGWQTTGKVEQEFGQLFGLHVQVFRRDGAAWVQTVDTDGRTLEEQNEAGRNASQEWMDGTEEAFTEQNPG